MDSVAENSDVVTMLDVLQDDLGKIHFSAFWIRLFHVSENNSELTDQASAVLAGSDEKNCNGFVKRQALYACLTCAPDAKSEMAKSIGVCLACSLHCHEQHELVELYTKRNFHCDCGIKEGSAPCQLDPTKRPQTTNNAYNQNFLGLYCKCHRPYPDPENPNDDEMIQCIACEDWYHCAHLITNAPPSEAFDEMICGDCVSQFFSSMFDRHALIAFL